VEDQSLLNKNSKLVGDSQLFHQLNLKDPSGLPSRKTQENARDTRTPGVQNNNQAPKDPARNK